MEEGMPFPQSRVAQFWDLQYNQKSGVLAQGAASYVSPCAHSSFRPWS